VLARNSKTQFVSLASKLEVFEFRESRRGFSRFPLLCQPPPGSRSGFQADLAIPHDARAVEGPLRRSGAVSEDEG
jgi:hypothetical protein